MATYLTLSYRTDAALLSRPVDLTALVSMSRASPLKFLEDGTLPRLVKLLLNEKNTSKSDKDTKLDCLNILANVSIGSKESTAEVRSALQGISEWFDEYIASEESEPENEPELHKSMVLLLARCWDYKLKTEDVLELTQGNRRIALCTVVGLLEDGETYSTELKQRQKPGQGKLGQWEHELVCHRYEKPLLLQICRLLRGFTHPGTYFEAKENEELTLFSVEKFADEMDTLLDITLRSRLVEKLSVALYDCLFELEDQYIQMQEDEGVEDGDIHYTLLEESDHLAVASAHSFLHNLYFYATKNNEEFRRHMLMDTLLIPRLVLPYLERCVLHATILNSRAEAYTEMLDGDAYGTMALHNPQLVKGIAASLRTLVIASFRAPTSQFVISLLRKLNPTAQMLRASAFCRHHEYIFALLCMLNINMGALDASVADADEGEDEEALYSRSLLDDLAAVYSTMDRETQGRVSKRVMFSGALPISRDTRSYAAVVSVLLGGGAGQFDYRQGEGSSSLSETMLNRLDEKDSEEEMQHIRESRAEAKKEAGERLNNMQQRRPSMQQDKGDGPAASTDAAERGLDPAESKSTRRPSLQGDASDNKEAAGGDTKGEAKGGKGQYVPKERDSSYRLLGDLPSLSRNSDQEKIKIALALELPNEGRSKLNINSSADNKVKSSSSSSNNNNNNDSTIPKEFLCAINGHVMKEPVRAVTSGIYFEKSTIELWLSSRGAICPITNEPLHLSDLEEADDVRNKIKRYQIMKHTSATVTSQFGKDSSNSNSNSCVDEDIYDF